VVALKGTTKQLGDRSPSDVSTQVSTPMEWLACQAITDRSYKPVVDAISSKLA